jgi:hypothetical protein
MNRESEVQFFLSKAVEAERRAAACRDEFARDSWYTIAQGYKLLAQSISGTNSDDSNPQAGPRK